MGGHSGSRTAAHTFLLVIDGSRRTLTKAQAVLLKKAMVGYPTPYILNRREEISANKLALTGAVSITRDERRTFMVLREGVSVRQGSREWGTMVIGEKTIGTSAPPHPVTPRLVGTQVENFNRLWGTAEMKKRDAALTEIGRADPAMAERVRRLLERLASEGPQTAEQLPQHLRGGVLQRAEDAHLVVYLSGVWKLAPLGETP